MANPRGICFSSVTVKSTLTVDHAIVGKQGALPFVKGVLELSLPATIFMLEVAVPLYAERISAAKRYFPAGNVMLWFRVEDPELHPMRR
jgi:hypothetical protein